MALTMERNGRKFIVDWKIILAGSWDGHVSKEFTIGDCCFFLQLYADVDKSGVKHLQLSKKPEKKLTKSNVHVLSLFNGNPRQIFVLLKDEDDIQLMPQTSKDQWGPVCWDLDSVRNV